mmetsp:Transcript_9126/g.16202  ORF Transcript_9126/g.16202 Transcript_9126/m.16202 type:complete len:87 (-) Transcript_9126:716-976(-)
MAAPSHCMRCAAPFLWKPLLRLNGLLYTVEPRGSRPFLSPQVFTQAGHRLAANGTTLIVVGIPSGNPLTDLLQKVSGRHKDANFSS